MLFKKKNPHPKSRPKPTREKNKKLQAIKSWLHNFGTSSRDIFMDWFSDQKLVVVVGSELRFAKDVYNEYKRTGKKIKIKPVETIKRLGKEEIDRLMGQLSDMYEEDYGRDLKEDFMTHTKAVIKGLKSGNLNEKGGEDIFETDEDIAFLFNNLDDLDDDDYDDYGENYNKFSKGDKLMNLKQLKVKLLNDMRVSTSSESMSIINGIESLNNKIFNLKMKVLAFGEECDSCEEENTFTDKVMTDKYHNLKEEIMSIIKAVATNGQVEVMYAKPLADLITSAVVTHIERRDDSDLADKEELTKEVEDVEDELEEIGADKVEEQTEDKLEDVKDAIEDDEVYNPEVNDEEEEKIDSGVYKSIGELASKGESSLYYGFREDDALIPSAGTIVDLFQLVFALPINLLNKKKISDIQNKYGSSFVIKQPMVVSSSMSKELAGKYSKALEVKYLLETKSIIEATVAKSDGGTVVSRAKDTVKFLTPANLKFKDAKLYDNSKVNYNEVIGVFSESKNPLRNTSSDALFMLPSISSVVERNKESYELMSNMNKYIYPSGEAGEFIQHGRDALPSYIEVTIEYIAPKNIVNFNVDNRTRTTTIGLQILPRSISNVDIVDTIADMDVKRFKDIKVSADEKNFIRKMKNLLRFWKKKGEGNELKVLKSNSFSDIVSKVEHVDTPMFHLVLTMDDHVMLKNNHKINLMDGSTYRKIMKALPLISISIVDEDTNNVSLSEGPVMNWYEQNIDEYIDSISQYEKDLKTIIKYNQYR